MGLYSKYVLPRVIHLACGSRPTMRQREKLVPGAGGEFLFCVHGRAPDPDVRRWQDRVDPVWRRFAGGCNLNRDIPGLIRESGFTVEGLETMYIPGWRPAGFNYWGGARP
jgi:hypothetical protein